MLATIMYVLGAVNLVCFVASLYWRDHWKTHVIFVPMGNLGGTILGFSGLLDQPFQAAAWYGGVCVILVGVFVGKRRKRLVGLS